MHDDATPTPRTAATVHMRTPTGVRMWRIDDGPALDMLQLLADELERARTLDAADFLDAARTRWPKRDIREIGAFPPARLDDVGWLYEITATEHLPVEVTTWGPDVGRFIPYAERGLGDFDPDTTPIDDPRWNELHRDRTACNGHRADTFHITANSPEPLTQRIRRLTLEHDPDRAADNDVPAPVDLAMTQDSDRATQRQRALMAAAVARWSGRSTTGGATTPADDDLCALLPDSDPLDDETRHDIETITGRPLRGVALSTGGYGKPIAANARTALNRWAVRMTS